MMSSGSVLAQPGPQMMRPRPGGREHAQGLGRAADHGERLHLGDGDGVGLGRGRVGARTGAGEGLEPDRAPVGLVQLVVEIDEVLQDGLRRLGIDIRFRLLGRGCDQRVEGRIGVVVDDEDLVGRHARVGGAAVVAPSNGSTQGGAHTEMSLMRPVSVSCWDRSRRPRLELGPLRRHRPGEDQLVLAGVAVCRRGGIVVVVTTPPPPNTMKAPTSRMTTSAMGRSA